MGFPRVRRAAGAPNGLAELDVGRELRGNKGAHPTGEAALGEALRVSTAPRRRSLLAAGHVAGQRAWTEHSRSEFNSGHGGLGQSTRRQRARLQGSSLCPNPIMGQVEGAFSQPNAGVCERMIEWAHAATAGSHDGDLLELYCGAHQATGYAVVTADDTLCLGIAVLGSLRTASQSISAATRWLESRG